MLLRILVESSITKKKNSLIRFLVRNNEIIKSIKIIQHVLKRHPHRSCENLGIQCFDREKVLELNKFEY